MKRARLPAAVFAGLLLASGSAAAQSAGQWQGPEHLWRAVCSYCHATGIGVQLLGARLPAATIAEFTRKGLKQMPPFAPSQISDAELTALADWISRSEPPPSASREKSP